MPVTRRPAPMLMPTSRPRLRHSMRGAAHSLLVVVALAAMVAAPAAQAQSVPDPIKDASADEMRDMLIGGSTTKAFRPTQPPTVDGLCPGSDDAPGPRSSTSSRNLVAVPYAPSGPGLQMAIEFANASDSLSPSDQRLLDKLATALRDPQLASRRFAVAGHTDATGSDKVNLQLSCARSLAVKRFLVSRGVSADRLSAYGFGSNRPLEAGMQASSRNRRVEVRRHDGEAS